MKRSGPSESVRYTFVNTNEPKFPSISHAVHGLEVIAKRMLQPYYLHSKKDASKPETLLPSWETYRIDFRMQTCLTEFDATRRFEHSSCFLPRANNVIRFSECPESLRPSLSLRSAINTGMHPSWMD